MFETEDYALVVRVQIWRAALGPHDENETGRIRSRVIHPKPGPSRARQGARVEAVPWVGERPDRPGSRR
jgi:hypothetical protein